MRKYVTGRVEVGGEPTHICTVPQDIQFVTVANVGDEVVYLGGPQVVSWSDSEENQPESGVGVGFPLAPGEKHDIPAYDSDAVELWAIAETVAVVAFLVSSGG